ncbi:hypothetical protein Y032_0094g2693 [Ancylostoma ceylanicum]|uniref:Uncharacterized protein n=1 Tax=Ancylostoma ceylanicum TaxID=53326 RepID=A0A016TL00_9BILA|nr:hypothetical protein Y032_0094g2693 [Ancylostoma ceylanicum]
MVGNIGQEALLMRDVTDSELEEGRDERGPGRPGNIPTDVSKQESDLCRSLPDETAYDKFSLMYVTLFLFIFGSHVISVDSPF